MEERELSWTAGGNVNLYSHYGEEFGDSFKKRKKIGIKLPYDPTISLLGLCLEETITGKDTCSPLLVAALFTIAKTQKQPRGPSRDE